MTIDYLILTWKQIAEKNIQEGNDNKVEKAIKVLTFINDNYRELYKIDGIISSKTCPKLFQLIKE
jgi:hypothetical protein